MYNCVQIEQNSHKCRFRLILVISLFSFGHEKENRAKFNKSSKVYIQLFEIPANEYPNASWNNLAIYNPDAWLFNCRVGLLGYWVFWFDNFYFSLSLSFFAKVTFYKVKNNGVNRY